MKHRWPKTLHSQIAAVFHSVRAIHSKKDGKNLGIRSFGAWQVYRYEAHRFAGVMSAKGRTSLLDTQSVENDMKEYLDERLETYVLKKRSRQTLLTILSGLGKFEYAFNHYMNVYLPDHPRLDTQKLRMDFYVKSRKLLPKSSKFYNNRAYPDPILLISTIKDPTFQLQAMLQYEGGLRTRGVGAPSNKRLKNPLTKESMRGIGCDPVTGMPVGTIASVEKGGKETEHMISVETYLRLAKHITRHGKLESDYSSYIEAINRAAKDTQQYAPGRASHGLKFNFAQERYLQCISRSMTHEQALQQTSLETSHFRLRETLTYTRG